MLLPIECIEEIICRLAPKQRWCVATDFRFAFIQSRCFGLAVVSMDMASRLGRCDILDAWKDQDIDLKLQYTTNAIDDASAQGHTQVLDWWVRSGLPLRYTQHAINNARKKCHVHVMIWWIHSRLRLLYSHSVMFDRHLGGTREFMEWWREHRFDFVHTAVWDSFSRQGPSKE